MDEQRMHPNLDSNGHIIVDIPWMRRWDKTPGESGGIRQVADKLSGILADVEFMTMLEELEYR